MTNAQNIDSIPLADQVVEVGFIPTGAWETWRFKVPGDWTAEDVSKAFHEGTLWNDCEGWVHDTGFGSLILETIEMNA